MTTRSSTRRATRFAESRSVSKHGADFFASFPDYRNIFDRLEVEDDRILVSGRSSCSDLRLDGPAIWIAKVSGDKLAEWRVYEDTAANRHTLGLGSS